MYLCVYSHGLLLGLSLSTRKNSVNADFSKFYREIEEQLFPKATASSHASALTFG